MRKRNRIQGKYQNPYFGEKQNTPTSVSGWIRKDGWAIIGSVLLVILLFGYLWMQQRWWYIDYIVVSGNSYIQLHEITDPAREIMQKKKLLILPKRLGGFFDEEKYANELHNRLSEVFALKGIEVERINGKTVHIRITERVPGFTYSYYGNNFYIDESGVITEQVANESELDPHFPRVRDYNEGRAIQVGNTVVKPEFVQFMVSLTDSFSKNTGLDISEFELTQVSCLQKQYVAEEIFAEEILESEDEEARSQKEDILERLRNDEITVDQSLDLLEEIKRAELRNDGSDENDEGEGTNGFVELKAEFVEADCDYLAVIRDVTVITQQGARIHFDTQISVERQLSNLTSVLQSEIEDVSAIDYIDVRFEDRVFYK